MVLVLIDLDHLEAGNAGENRLHVFLHAIGSPVEVKRNPLVDRSRAKRFQGIEIPCQIFRHVDKRKLVISGSGIKRAVLRVLHLAGGTESNHLLGAVGPEFLEGPRAHGSPGLEIAHSEMVDAAAVAQPAHHLAVQSHPVEYIHARKQDVRRLEDMTPEIEKILGGRLLPVPDGGKTPVKLGRGLDGGRGADDPA